MCAFTIVFFNTMTPGVNSHSRLCTPPPPVGLIFFSLSPPLATCGISHSTCGEGRGWAERGLQTQAVSDAHWLDHSTCTLS